jgi:hypothetical protein
MPRLSSISNRLVTVGSKRTPVFIKFFTGTDFSSVNSTWTFSTGTISLRATSLPYHSYGNSREPTTAVTTATTGTWLLRAGPFTGVLSIGSIYTYQLNAITTQTSFTSTVVATTVTSLTTITETIIVFDTTSTAGLTTNTSISFANNSVGLDTGVVYYVKNVTSSSFRVSAAMTGPLINLTNTGTVLATIQGITTASSKIGYWLNGVNIRNSSAGDEVPNGYLSFSNLNYIAEYKTALRFNYDLNYDRAGGRTINSGSYAYHGYSFADAWTTGTAHIGTTGTAITTGTAEISRIPYLATGLTGADGHSKIVGWSLDGYPIYGPYGYESPLDNNSRIRPITSGYTTYDRPEDVPARQVDGVLDTNSYPLGIFVQDYYYAGIGDLDVHNGRYCVTPEYPSGTYAYFCSIDPTSLNPTYPFVIGPVFRSILDRVNLPGIIGPPPKQTI